MWDELGAGLVWVVSVLLAVAVIAPIIRGVTVGLNHSLGQVWPFSHAHCVAKTTPGCDEGPSRTEQATR